MFDYSKLRGKIKEKFGTQAAFATAMETSSTTLSEKLNGKVSWNQMEIDKACPLLEISKDNIPTYFFTQKV